MKRTSSSSLAMFSFYEYHHYLLHNDYYYYHYYEARTSSSSLATMTRRRLKAARMFSLSDTHRRNRFTWPIIKQEGWISRCTFSETVLIDCLVRTRCLSG